MSSWDDDWLPDALRANGRPVVDEFSPSECLYRRVREHEFRCISDGTGACLEAPAFSVNRERFSEALWVLLPLSSHGGCAVVSFRVEHIPTDDLNSGNSPYVYTCGVDHVPEPDNYSHSEVRWYRDGQFVPGKEPSRTARVALRQCIAEQCEIICRPGEGPQKLFASVRPD